MERLVCGTPKLYLVKFATFGYFNFLILFYLSVNENFTQRFMNCTVRPRVH